MSKQKEIKEQLPEPNEQGEGSRQLTGKKPFIEPKVSAPVNVLDATTNFLQATAVTTVVSA